MAIYKRNTTVFATDKNKHKETGAEITTSKEMAEHLVNKGMATYEGESKKKKKKGEE